jgi:hypothetical protein
VGIATGWTARVRSPTGTREFSLLHSVKTGSGPLPVSHPMDTGGSTSIPKGKSARDWRWSLPSSAVDNDGAILPAPHTPSSRGD